MRKSIFFSMVLFSSYSMAQTAAQIKACERETAKEIAVIDEDPGSDAVGYTFQSQTGRRIGTDLIAGLNMNGPKLVRNSTAGTREDAIRELRRQKKRIGIFISTSVFKSATGVGLSLIYNAIDVNSGRHLFGENRAVDYSSLPAACKQAFDQFFANNSQGPVPDCLGRSLGDSDSQMNLAGAVKSPVTRNPALHAGRVLRTQLLAFCEPNKAPAAQRPIPNWKDIPDKPSARK